MTRRKYKDRRRIDPETYRHVKRRDQGCVAALYLGAKDVCRDAWGRLTTPYDEKALEVDHINAYDLAMSVGTPDRLAIVCAWHHRLSNEWRATSHRPEMRLYAELTEAGERPRQAGKKVLTEYGSGSNLKSVRKGS